MTKVTRLTLEQGRGLERRRLHLREISDEADAPLDTVGQDLRAARQRRGEDLATVSKILKIRKDHLEAVEEGNLDALPGRTYAIGFVRSYAEYLGLDAPQCVERFKAEIAGRGEAAAPILFTDAEEEENSLPHGWVVMAIFLLLLVAYGAYYLSVSADRLLSEPVAQVPERLLPAGEPRSAPETAAPAGDVSGTPSTALRESPSDESAASASPPMSGAGETQAASVDSTAMAEDNAGVEEVAAVDDGAAATIPAAADLPRGRVFGARNEDPRVILRIYKQTKVLVQDPDGTVYINRTLRPGDTYRVPNLLGLVLTTPNGGAVGIELDGLAMGFAGTVGKVSEAVSLDPQAIVDRYNASRGG